MLFRSTSPKGKRTTFPKVLIGDIRNFPIKEPDSKQEVLITDSVKKIVDLTNTFVKFQSSILLFFKNKLELENISNNLQSWDSLEFKDFIKELKKLKIVLSLSDESEWMNYFNEQKEKAKNLKTEIDKTDREIDQMIYGLYGLSEDRKSVV